MILSKSDYMLYLRHPAYLWFKKFDKNKLPETDSSTQARFDEGNLFELYAEKLFPDAVKLGYKTDGEFDGFKYKNLPKETKKELDKKTEVILQGRLEVDGLTCIFDCLKKVGVSEYDLYEIKSSTGERPEHICDLAFQSIVLEKCGLKIRNTYVICVNNDYVRDGDVKPIEICLEKDVTSDVRGVIEETIENIGKAKKIIFEKIMSDLSVKYLNQGDIDEWKEIYQKVYGEFERYSIYNMCWLNKEFILKCETASIRNIADMPDDFELHPRQLEQVLATKKSEPIINKDGIKNFLDELQYPIYFFDYETYSSVIPNFDGEWPYGQFCFQYSLHILESESAEIKHKEFLHTENSSPILKMLEQMKKDFGDTGTILTWHMSFEKGRNKEMGEMFPEYKSFLENLNERIVDLKTPFATGQYIDKDFFGSASIKDVLPVLVPELSYKELNIGNGSLAQQTWMNTFLHGKNPESREQVKRDLLEYCKLDTLAMVRIFKFLNGII